MPPKWSIVVVLGSSFCISFLYVSQLPESYFATGIMRKPLLYHFRPPILASNINKKQGFFQPVSWTSFFHLLFEFVQKLSILRPPLKIQWAPKWNPKPTNFEKVSKSCINLSEWRWFVSRPAFPETIVITMPFGPNVFLKVICSKEIG